MKKRKKKSKKQDGNIKDKIEKCKNLWMIQIDLKDLNRVYNVFSHKYK